LVSFKELERRWKEVRAAMARQGLDWLVCESTCTAARLAGLVRWFTDRWHLYKITVAFPIEGDIYCVTHGDPYRKMDSPGIKNLVKPYVQTLSAKASTGADLLIDILRRSRPRKIGLVGYGTLSASTYLTLRESLPDAEFVDASDLVDEIKAVKSEEELSYIRRTAEIHDEIWEEVVLKSVRPGKTPAEVLRKAVMALMEKGGVGWWGRASAAPPDRPCSYLGPSDRVMKDGDVFVMLMEFGGPEGYYCEIMRNVCLGRVPRELEEAFDDVKEAQQRMVRKLVPGADPHEVLKESDVFLKEKGHPTETRLAGHSQGLDLVERPALSPLGETIKLKRNMVLAIHPTVYAEKAEANICDNFVVTDTGGKRLQRTPQEIFIV